MVADMQRAWREGRHQDAMDLQFHLMPLHDAMFCESSPGPVKYAAELLGICSSETRLPICEISDENKQKVKAALVSVGLLN
jgi:4-hydroxy-tetrahydrodipicolinate synthase